MNFLTLRAIWASNVILPWYWTRAHRGKGEELLQMPWGRYLAWPAAHDISRCA
jgi:hypothetical protein